MNLSHIFHFEICGIPSFASFRVHRVWCVAVWVFRNICLDSVSSRNYAKIRRLLVTANQLTLAQL